MRVVLAGSASAIERVTSALRTSFEHEGLNLELLTAPQIDASQPLRELARRDAPRPAAEVWLDLRAQPAVLFLIGARSELVFVRALAVRPEPDSVETELIRFIVDQSVEEMIHGQPQGLTQGEFARSWLPSARVHATDLQNEPPARPRRSEYSGVLALGYVLTVFDANVFGNSLVLRATLDTPLLRFGFDLLQSMPLELQRGESQLEFLTSGVRATVSLPLRIRGHWVAVFGVGGGVDETHVSTRTLGARPDFWASDPIFGVKASLEYSWRSVVWSAMSGADATWTAPHYVIVRAGESSRLWSPARVRPLVGLLLGYRF